MLIVPQEVRDYSTIKSVKDRSEEQLIIDIIQAESKLMEVTGRATDDAIFSPLPEGVNVFLIRWAEYYAANSDFANSGQYKSETFDDYKYDKFDTAKIVSPDINGLIKSYIMIEDVTGRQIIFRMRAI